MSELALKLQPEQQAHDARIVVFPQGSFDSSLFEMFLKNHSRNATTAKAYRSYLQHFREYLEGNSIGNPSADDVAAYAEQMQLKGLEPTTQAHYIRCVKQ